MALMTWSESFSVGVKALDDQHKVLVKAVNDLHAAMMGKQSKAVTGPLLGMLVKYTHDHFSAEEAFMTRTRYPNLAPHCSKHRDLILQVEQFVERYERGEIAINVDLVIFLRDWLINHILKEDREYGPWMNQNGVI